MVEVSMSPKCPKCGKSNFFISNTDISYESEDMVDHNGEQLTAEINFIYCSDCGTIIGQKQNIDFPEINDINANLSHIDFLLTEHLENH
jgi:NMD protein affecting ribosome stability and mRNA decay